MSTEFDQTREELYRELEGTRLGYYELLATIPDDDWERPTTNPSWNVRQVLLHITTA